jgi:hypothetical protein
MEPEIDCPCFTIKQNKNQFEMTLKNEKLTEKNLGEYELEIEFFDQKGTKIFGSGAKTTLYI